jgi:hypothetical protein
MDDATVDAMVSSGLEYFVTFMEHHYAPFAYRRMPLRPMRVATNGGAIWMVPVNVETNNRPWRFVKRLVEASVSAGQEEGWQHVNVLLHPFRDGALRHIGDLRRLLVYLRETLGYQPIRLGDVVAGLPADPPDTFVYYELGRNGEAAPTKRRYAGRWWRDRSRYEERVGSVYRALAAEGRAPALKVRSGHEAPAPAPAFAVYPHLPRTGAQPAMLELDPLDPQLRGLRKAVVGAAASGNESCHAFIPKGIASDLLMAARACRPRRLHDYAGVFPETALRLAYRLTRGKHVF